MNPEPLPTRFAPAERAAPEAIRAQTRALAGKPVGAWALDAVPDIFLVVNAQRQIVFANRALADLLGTDDRARLCGQRPGEALGCVHAFESPGGCGTTEFCSTCGAVHAILTSLAGEPAQQECRITLRGGGSLDLRVWAAPLPHDGLMYAIFAAKDISHEKRRQALERIFFHDILNTAGGVHGLAELIRDASVQELDELKEDIFALSDRLIDEIKAQRELSAAENNELAVHPQLINALSLLREVEALYRSHDAARGRRLRIDPGAQELVFYSDDTLLRRVIGNMVKNALEASLPGEAVTLDCRLRDHEVTFRVHNPACMPRDVQLQVFQRSFSTKGAGRGLGTYSMQLLTERYLRGHISFTSSPEGGTTFTACYPIRLETPAAQE